MLFERGKAELSYEAKLKINEIVTRIKTSDISGMKISVRVDELTDSKKNKALAQRRADSIRNYIINQGVKREILIAEGNVFHRAPDRKTDYVVEVQIKNRGHL